MFGFVEKYYRIRLHPNTKLHNEPQRATAAMAVIRVSRAYRELQRIRSADTNFEQTLALR